MRILQVISYGFLCGGAEKSVLLLKQGLTAEGHEVRVLSSDKGEPAERFSEYTFPQIMPGGVGKYIHHLWYRRARKALAAAIADFKPDLVHFHTMGELSPATLFALGDIPAVMTVHGPETYMPSMLPWTVSSDYFKDGQTAREHPTVAGKLALLYYQILQRPIYSRGLRHIHAIIAPHGFIAKKIKEDNLSPRTLQIWNGIKLPAPAPVTTTNHILFVGRLETYKGVSYLLQAVKELCAELPDIKLTVVGDGPERASLEQYARQHNLHEHVTFTGWLPGSEVFACLRSATVVAIPSTVPELPTVCFEALAIGRPVIGTNLGAMPEVITPETGVTIPPADIAALKSALQPYLQLDLRRLQVIAKNCSDSVQRFSLENFVHSTAKVYQEIADKR